MYYTAANALLKRFTHIEIQHVPRMENQEANDLAQTASGYKISKERMQEPTRLGISAVRGKPLLRNC